MDCYLYLDGEAAALWQKLPKEVWNTVVSELLLDAHRQGKLDTYLSAPESSPQPARAGEYEVRKSKDRRV